MITATTFQISAGRDDWMIHDTSFSPVTPNIYIHHDKFPVIAGLRFIGVDIPPGEIVIRVCPDLVSAKVVMPRRIAGYAEDNALPASSAEDHYARPKTDAYIDWIPPVFSKDVWVEIPVTPIIQEIVNGPGWKPGNSLVVFIDSLGDYGVTNLRFYAYDSAPTKAAILEVIPAEFPVLTVNSTPVSVPVTIDGKSVGNTPVEVLVGAAEHTVTVPEEVEV